MKKRLSEMGFLISVGGVPQFMLFATSTRMTTGKGSGSPENGELLFSVFPSKINRLLVILAAVNSLMIVIERVMIFSFL